MSLHRFAAVVPWLDGWEFTCVCQKSFVDLAYADAAERLRVHLADTEGEQ